MLRLRVSVWKSTSVAFDQNTHNLVASVTSSNDAKRRLDYAVTRVPTVEARNIHKIAVRDQQVNNYRRLRAGEADIEAYQFPLGHITAWKRSLDEPGRPGLANFGTQNRGPGHKTRFRRGHLSLVESDTRKLGAKLQMKPKLKFKLKTQWTFWMEEQTMTPGKFFKGLGTIDCLVRKRALPEAFIWVLFRNLLENILLRGKPETAYWRAYPSPVLGNFGSLESIRNVSGRGTSGFYTPGKRPKSAQHSVPIALELKSTAQNYTSTPLASVYVCLPQENQGIEPLQELRGTTDARSNYSSYLERIVGGCLTFSVANRYSLAELPGLIDAGIAGLKKLKPNIDNKEEEELPLLDRVMFQDDPFSKWGYLG
ncbi:hypothetical protein BU23DRAFT_568021 [Bimuria novae-zelandiae CBS 107.79]|uniref:Uncharacterized protein n=1 Tax=Bimuria novae-zelandiae CBS 107.79 TaxID=1447943 RepID=A0A6A5VJS8_9PLEO|nr:hypothetical protein BU23DRAFT_568021 [Bimuria novae-zelandiae CBS 107.79]